MNNRVTMSNTLPIPPSIADDDPEVLRVLASIRKPVLKLSEVISAGPHGRTKVYQDLSTGLLTTFVSSGRRFVFAIDYARYLVALRRIGDLEGRRHHLAKPENRPAHDPRSGRHHA
jgi:hypothetical protein